MSKQLGLAIAAGLTSAVVFLLVGDVLPPLVYLAPLPLFAAGLGLGLAAVLIAGGIAAAAVLVAGGVGAVLPFVASAVLPSVVVVRQALLWRTTTAGPEWYPPGLLLGWLTGLAAVALVAAALLVPEHADGLEGLVREQVGHGIDALGIREPRLRETLEALWVPFLPAMVTAAWLMVAMANAVLAQWLLVRAGRNLRPTPAYQAMALPDWIGGALLVAMAVTWLSSGSIAYLARNLTAVLLVPYVLLGLAGIHGLARKRSNGGMLLALFYGLFFMMFGWAVIAVAGYGLVRHWTTLRRRIGGRSKEEE